MWLCGVQRHFVKKCGKSAVLLMILSKVEAPTKQDSHHCRAMGVYQAGPFLPFHHQIACCQSCCNSDHTNALNDTSRSGCSIQRLKHSVCKRTKCPHPGRPCFCRWPYFSCLKTCSTTLVRYIFPWSSCLTTCLAHQALHWGPLYRHIHKLHHKYLACFDLAAKYAHSS